MVEKGVDIAPANGKLGILLVGLGAVSTTFVAGVEAIRKGTAEPIGSLTQMGAIRLGKRTDNRNPKIKDFVPLADLNDIEFGAWDIFSDTAYEAALHAGVLEKALVEDLREQLDSLKPMPAVFNQNYVKRLNGTNVKEGKNKMELAEQLMSDIAKFKEEKGCDRLVIVWAASTEIFLEASEIHQTVEAFEKAMYDNDERIAPSMIYAYAAIKSGVPFANGAPNLTVDIPALLKLAEDSGVPICGKDFKTGQTLMKTILAPGLEIANARSRRLVFDEYLRKPRRRSFGRSRKFQNKRRIETFRSRTYFAARNLSRTLQRFFARRPHQLLSAARR